MEDRTGGKWGDRFLQRSAALAHDMRTPLENVIALAQMSLDRIEEDAQKETIRPYLCSILTAAKDLELLTTDLLSPERGEQAERFTARELAISIGETVSGRAKAKGLAVHIDVSGLGEMPLEGDRAALLRILSNLMSNAIKYTPTGGRVSMTARIARRGRDGMLDGEFIVEDTGIGMDEAFVARMYEPFLRSQEALDRQIPGQGLGLAIVQRLTARMKGTIAVKSRPGEGTRFCVRVPLRYASEEIHAPGKGVALTGRVFLLAEDNDLSARIAQELLARKGASVRRASDGAQAVRLFRSSAMGTFDAILMDMWMPQMGGCMAAEEIRSMPRADAGRIPILALTASASALDERMAKAAGMNGCLRKPLDTGRLSAVMQCAEEK